MGETMTKFCDKIEKSFGGIYRGKKVIVTGHTGFKGAWLSQWLMELGAEVHGLSLYVPSEPALFTELNWSGPLSNNAVDIRSRADVSKFFAKVQPSIVFHLAAQPIVSESFRDPHTTFETNALGTLNILSAIKETSSVKSAVVITSDKCYENVEWEFGYREDDALGGKDPYSASKACAEIIFSSFFRSFLADGSPSLKIATTRAGNVIGGGDWAKDRIIPDCIKSWASGKTVQLRSPNSTRPWQHVLDPLSGYLLLGQKLFENTPYINGESFNFGPPATVNFPVSDLVAKLSQIFDTTAKFEIVQNNLKEAGLLKLCCDKALHRLKWRPTLEYQHTVEMTGSWYRDFYFKKVPAKELTIGQIHQYTELARSTSQSWT